MREALRLQKGEFLSTFLESQPFGLAIALQYVGKGLLDYQFMHNRMADMLVKLQDECIQVHLGQGD